MGSQTVYFFSSGFCGGCLPATAMPTDGRWRAPGDSSLPVMMNCEGKKGPRSPARCPCNLPRCGGPCTAERTRRRRRCCVPSANSGETCSAAGAWSSRQGASASWWVAARGGEVCRLHGQSLARMQIWEWRAAESYTRACSRQPVPLPLSRESSRRRHHQLHYTISCGLAKVSN
jgi:hypothetical protein